MGHLENEKEFTLPGYNVRGTPPGIRQGKETQGRGRGRAGAPPLGFQQAPPPLLLPLPSWLLRVRKSELERSTPLVGPADRGGCSAPSSERGGHGSAGVAENTHATHTPLPHKLTLCPGLLHTSHFQPGGCGHMWPRP